MQSYIIAGNHTFAAVKGDESYELLSTALKPVFDEMNILIKRKTIQVCGKDVPLEFYLGGDYKVCLNSTWFCALHSCL